MNPLDDICLLGFGEVGATLAGNLAGRSKRLRTYDPLLASPVSAPSLARRKMPAVVACATAADAVRGCSTVISAVTADQCVVAADSAARALSKGAWYVDLNSVSPGTRREAAAIIEEAQARYVECAVMGPIQPLGIATAMLAGGPFAAEFVADAEATGFTGARLFAPEVGPASAAKMCRSVVIKGIETLLTESLLAARHHGVESDVIESLDNLLPGIDWAEHARYMISRTLVHGARRAEEMQQVAATLKDAGVDPIMSEACARRQELASRYPTAAHERELALLLDHLLELGGEQGVNPGGSPCS